MFFLSKSILIAFLFGNLNLFGVNIKPHNSLFSILFSFCLVSQVLVFSSTSRCSACLFLIVMTFLGARLIPHLSGEGC